jgi:hypothetical protein
VNPEVKAKWLAALRSGEYRQGKHALNTGGPEGQFCCLGVLCEVALQEGLEGLERTQPFASEGDDDAAELHYNGESGRLPYRVQVWADLTDPNPSTSRTYAEVLPEQYSNPNSMYGKVKITLAELNDSGYTFQQIADVIERDF